MVTLVDSNVIFDFLTEDETWFEWSASMLQKSATDGTLAINPIIYAEIGSRYHTVEDLDTDLAAEYFTRAPLPWEAAFLADRVLLMSAPPGTMLVEERISARRPREFEDVLLSKVVVDIHDHLIKEVNKVVEGEVDA